MHIDSLVAYLEIFHAGERYAITSRELEKSFDITGVMLRRQINALRKSGVPIVSDGNGYYYAETEMELRRTIAHMKHRISGIGSAIQGLEKALAQFDTAQCRLPLEGGDDE